jgi:hypothetical protein
VGGFEPPISASQAQRITGLSYTQVGDYGRGAATMALQEQLAMASA